MCPRFSFWRALPVLLLLMLGAGCNKDAPPLAPVRGRVFYHDAPLHSGTIVFTPDSDRGGRGPLARADIQSDGTFILSTGGDPGAVAGWHRVTVLALETPSPDANGQTGAAPRFLLPSKYSDPDLSGLLREVRAEGDNNLELRLE